MAIVNGPLFSLEASGKLGNALVYTKWKGRSVVREYVIPANPNTLAQRYQRTYLKVLNFLWDVATDDDKASWLDLAIAGNYSTFNAFCSFNLDAMVAGEFPTVNRDEGENLANSEVYGMGFNGAGPGKISVQISTDPRDSEEMIILQIVPGTIAPNESPSFWVGGYTETAESIDVIISDLQPGTYIGRAFTIEKYGGWRSGVESNDIVVP